MHSSKGLNAIKESHHVGTIKKQENMNDFDSDSSCKGNQ